MHDWKKDTMKEMLAFWRAHKRVLVLSNLVAVGVWLWLSWWLFFAGGVNPPGNVNPQEVAAISDGLGWLQRQIEFLFAQPAGWLISFLLLNAIAVRIERRLFRR